MSTENDLDAFHDTYVYQDKHSACVFNSLNVHQLQEPSVSGQFSSHTWKDAVSFAVFPCM